MTSQAENTPATAAFMVIFVSQRTDDVSGQTCQEGVSRPAGTHRQDRGQLGTNI